MAIIRVVGIGLTEEEAITDPKSSLTVNSCDKLYAGCEILHNGAPFALQLIIDGETKEGKKKNSRSSEWAN